MATSPMSTVIQHLHRVLRNDAGLTDGQLLEDYISRRDDAAFAALVRRHGSMVWGVCRRVLANHHDAEDAFQATFLVLVRRAASIASRELLANWLYGVAHQTALKARATAARRKGRERQVTEMPEPAVAHQDPWPDLQTLLDEALSRLPDKYRGVIVLCDLEGKTRKEAAQHLGLPEGTVASRLVRARLLLAKRFTQRGIALSGGALAALLAQQAASAGVPTSVVESTINAASLFAAGQAAAMGTISLDVVALTEGVMKAMFLTKLKAAVAVVLMLGLLATGATLLTCRTAAGQDDKEPAAEKSEKSGKPAAKPNKGKETVTAWGKEIGGLQAGLGFRPGAQRTYHYGETVTLVLRVRNVGKDTVKFSYLYPFIEHSLTVTGSDGKPIPQPKVLRDVGGHLPRPMELTPGKEIELRELKRVLRPAKESPEKFGLLLYGTGKIAVQYDQVLGPNESRHWKQAPALGKLATGKLELEVKSDPSSGKSPPSGSPEDGRGKPAARHDFTNLQRLATALENFNYPDHTATTITVWCQGGGKGTSITIADEKRLDVATACYWGVNGHHNKKGLDLENVAIISANDRSIRFVNVKKEVAAKRPIGLTVHPGDLVVVLERVAAKKPGKAR